MSRNINKFMDAFQSAPSNFTKLSASHNVGGRIFPSRTHKNDQAHELRLDAGPLIDDRYRQVHLQVNSEAKSKALKDWVRKHGSHANLVTALFDTEAEDKDGEADRFCGELREKAKSNL